MGFVSFRTSDTNESISNACSSKGAKPVKMVWYNSKDQLCEVIENHYSGYGDFASVDFFALVDELNGGDGDRDKGIDLYFDYEDKDDPLEAITQDNISMPRFVEPDWKGDARDVATLNFPEQCDCQGCF